MLFNLKIASILEHSYIYNVCHWPRDFFWTLPLPTSVLMWVETNIVQQLLLNSNCPSNSVTLSIIAVVASYMFFLFMTKQSFKIKRLGIFNVNEVVNNWFNDQFGVKMPFIKKKFFLFFYIIFLFIIVSNVGGLLPFTETVTVYLILNLFFSFTIQFGLMIYSLFVYKWDYLRGFLPQGVPPVVALLLLPVEFISFISRILSLGIRLFANMFAGHCVMIIICMIIVLAFEGLGLAASPVFFPIFCTVFVLICLLEIAVALLQAYVFLSLVLIYLNVHLEFH